LAQGGNKYTPANLTIHAGDKVVWRWFYFCTLHNGMTGTITVN
jgi:plastocyanin